jgi:hypothetical protein
MKYFKEVHVENHELPESQDSLKRHVENNIVTSLKKLNVLPDRLLSIHHSFSFVFILFFLLHGLCYYFWLL